MELKEQVCAVIERETGQKVTGETELDSLPGDSLDFLNLLHEIELEVGKDIPRSELATVKDIFEALC